MDGHTYVRTYGRTDGQTFETGFIRSTLWKSQPKNVKKFSTNYCIIISQVTHMLTSSTIDNQQLTTCMRSIKTDNVIKETIFITVIKKFTSVSSSNNFFAAQYKPKKKRTNKRVWVLLIVEPKCTLAASHAAPWWVTVEYVQIRNQI